MPIELFHTPSMVFLEKLVEPCWEAFVMNNHGYPIMLPLLVYFVVRPFPFSIEDITAETVLFWYVVLVHLILYQCHKFIIITQINVLVLYATQSYASIKLVPAVT